MPNREWLSPKEAAEVLGVTYYHVMNLIRRGELPSRKVGKRIYRIPAAAVSAEGWLKRREEEKGPE